VHSGAISIATVLHSVTEVFCVILKNEKIIDVGVFGAPYVDVNFIT